MVAALKAAPMFSRGIIFGFMLACLPLFAAAAAELQYVVIAVTGPEMNIKEGQRIDAGKTITLPPETSVRLLSATGRMISISGPFSGPVAAPETGAPAGDAQVVARLAKFLSERPAATSALGAMRSVPLTAHTKEPSDPWHIVISESDIQCGRPPHIQMWRKDARKEAHLQLTSAGGDAVRVVWPKEQNTLPLPAQFVVDQSSFQAVVGNQVMTVRLRLSPEALSNPAEIADWMVATGCKRQAILFLETLR